MITGGEHNVITSIIHNNEVVKGLYLNGGGDENSNQRRDKTPPSARTQTFYPLAKTHKETLKIRSIVLGREGIFDYLGWPLKFILKPLLARVKVHVRNTPGLLDDLNEPSIAERKGKIESAQ